MSYNRRLEILNIFSESLYQFKECTVKTPFTQAKVLNHLVDYLFKRSLWSIIKDWFILNYRNKQ